MTVQDKIHPSTILLSLSKSDFDDSCLLERLSIEGVRGRLAGKSSSALLAQFLLGGLIDLIATPVADTCAIRVLIRAIACAITSLLGKIIHPSGTARSSGGIAELFSFGNFHARGQIASADC